MTKGSDDIRMTLKSWTLLLTKYLIETQTRKRRKKKAQKKHHKIGGQARIQIVYSIFLSAVTKYIITDEGPTMTQYVSRSLLPVMLAL